MSGGGIGRMCCSDVLWHGLTCLVSGAVVSVGFMEPSSLRVNEGEGSVEVCVQMTGLSAIPLSVDIATESGTARGMFFHVFYYYKLLELMFFCSWNWFLSAVYHCPFPSHQSKHPWPRLQLVSSRTHAFSFTDLPSHLCQCVLHQWQHPGIHQGQAIHRELVKQESSSYHRRGPLCQYHNHWWWW